MAEHERFYLVVDADVVTEGVTPSAVLIFRTQTDAIKAAQELCVEHPGKLFVPFEPGEGWRASKPYAQKTYLAWPKAETEPAEPPPAPDSLSLATGGAL